MHSHPLRFNSVSDSVWFAMYYSNSLRSLPSVDATVSTLGIGLKELL